MTQMGFISCINDNTRVTHENSSCIDHIFMKNRHGVRGLTPIIPQSQITDY